ncbi:TRI15 protein, partial [Hippolais icterina]|nr:TRI15 protein [Hippolais icterina]
LKEQKDILMTKLIQVSQVLFERKYEFSTRLSETESLMDTVIAQLKKQDQPVVEFLMDVGKILSSCEAAKAPVPELISPELQRSVENISEMIQRVVDMVAQFKVNLWCKTEKKMEMVTREPETVNPYLGLSQDHKVIQLRDGIQNLPDTSRRFMTDLSFVGSQG